MADALHQAVQDGILDPEWAQAHQQQFQDVQDKYEALKKAAGSNSTLKAILHGAGIGGAFLAGSIPGAELGAGITALIPVVGETGIAELIGGELGGMATGSAAAWAAHQALEKLGEYSEAVNSLNKSAELHPMADAAGQFIGMSLNAPSALRNLANTARLAAEVGTTADAVKLVAKIAGVRAAGGAGFELVIRPAFETARNAVLDQLNIAHDAVQPPTVSSLITSAAMAIVSAHDDPRLSGYSARQIASIATRAKIRSDAGIPLGSEDGPAVAAVFNRRGINVDPNDPMTRPLSGDEQAVNDALQKKTQETQHKSVPEGASEPTAPDTPQRPLTPRRDTTSVTAGASEPVTSNTPDAGLTLGRDADRGNTDASPAEGPASPALAGEAPEDTSGAGNASQPDSLSEPTDPRKRMNVGPSGHHVPAVRKAEDRPFEIGRGNKSRPTFHFLGDDPDYDHWRLHRAERPFVGRRTGPFNGSDDELFAAYRKAYQGLDDIRVDVRAPDGKTLLGSNVSPLEGIDLIENWLRQQGQR